MPDVGTQVYWHDLPNAAPPWRSTMEHKRMLRLSRMIPSRISSLRHMFYYTPSLLLQRSKVRRCRRPPAPRHWGIVLEPHLSPLHGLNMMMRELCAAPVTLEEAAAAVSALGESFPVWSTQPSQPTQLSQPVDVREAPLLDVVRTVCAARGLAVRPYAKADIRRRRRLGVAEVIPRRRVLLAVDRRTPRFVMVFAVPDAAENAHRAKYMQLIAPTSVPVPWRRLARSYVGAFPVAECVVAAVERHTEDEGTDVKEEKGVVMMGKPLFSATDRIADDPLFQTPVAVLGRASQRSKWRSDWIQRLNDRQTRERLYSTGKY